MSRRARRDRRTDVAKVAEKVKKARDARRRGEAVRDVVPPEVKKRKVRRSSRWSDPASSRWRSRAEIMKQLRRRGRATHPKGAAEVVLYVDHMTVVLDEKIRAAARATSAFVDVGRILRDLCELCLESDHAGRLSSRRTVAERLRRLALDRALSRPVRGLGHGMTEVHRLLGLVPAPSPDVRSLIRRANLEDQLLRRGSLFYVKYQRSCRNRVNDVVLYARRIRHEHGLAAAARSARECLADAGEEAPWFRRAVELVVANWQEQDPRLIALARGSATRGSATRGSATRGFATREFATRGFATRGFATRGSATRRSATRESATRESATRGAR